MNAGDTLRLTVQFLICYRSQQKSGD